MKRKAGKGSVYRYRNGWRAIGPRRDDGSRQELGVFATRAEALGELAAFEQIATGSPKGLTVAAWGARWLDERMARGALKEASVWRSHVATHAIADRMVKRLTRQDVLVWLKELATTEAVGTKTKGRRPNVVTTTFGLGRPISWQTRKHALRVLLSALEAALDAGIIGANPARGVRLPRETNAHLDTHAPVDGAELGWTWLSADEIAKLLAVRPDERNPREVALLEHHKLVWTVAIYTGLRPGELWGLRWCDVSLEGPQPVIHVRRSYRGPPKTPHAVREVPLLPAAAEALRQWLKLKPGIGEALVFPAEHGGCRAEGYSAGFRTWVRRAGIARPGLVPRTWRHTFASHLVQGTWTEKPLRLEEVRQAMGHSNITVTQRYAHLAPGALRDLLGGVPKEPSGGAQLAHIGDRPRRKPPT